jgi:hypothetical protein
MHPTHPKIVLNVHAPTEDKTDDVKDSFYDELEPVFDEFPKYHMKILLGGFNAKVGREDIISVGFDITDQLLIRFYAFIRYCGKMGVQ